MSIVARTELAQAIANLLDQTKNTAETKKVAQEVAAYLVSQHQTKDLDLIMRDVMTIRAQRGIVEAEVTTAFPLSSVVNSEVQKLLSKEYPTAQQLVTRAVVEPEVLSGVKIRTADKQLDETARGKLDQLTRVRM